VRLTITGRVFVEGASSGPQVMRVGQSDSAQLTLTGELKPPCDTLLEVAVAIVNYRGYVDSHRTASPQFASEMHRVQLSMGTIIGLVQHRVPFMEKEEAAVCLE
jgi:hypothetical protein